MKEGLGGGSDANCSAIAGETNNGVNGSDLNWLFIADYCEPKRFEPVRFEKCERIAFALAIAIPSGGFMSACASELEGTGAAWCHRSMTRRRRQAKASKVETHELACSTRQAMLW